jgi:hypothetical protein
MNILKPSIFLHTTDCGHYRDDIPPVERLKNFLIDRGKLNNGETFTELCFLIRYLRVFAEAAFFTKILKFT